MMSDIERVPVSVVTPSFNQAQFLEQTIRSVLDQRYPNLEYLVMDGGSTDGSVEIIKRYVEQLAFWVSEPDAGQAGAINKGWQRARGDILAYLNSDDLYRPGAIRRAVAYLEAHPDVGMVYGPCDILDAQGRLTDVREMADCSLERLLRYPLPQPTIFFRRWVFERLGWLNENLHCTMDWELTIRAVLAGIPIGRLTSESVAAARIWPGAKTSNLFEQCVKESLSTRQELLTHPGLSSEVVDAITQSLAQVLLWPAYSYYVRGRMPAARRLLHRAIAMQPSLLLHGEFTGLYVRTLMGRSLSAAARTLKARVVGSTTSSAGGWSSQAVNRAQTSR